MTTLDIVLDSLEYLKMNSSIEEVTNMHNNGEITDETLMSVHRILNKQVEAKEVNNKLYNVKVAAFPFKKTLDDFDFKFQPSIDEDMIRRISQSNFYEEAKNIVFVGTPGVGKTHLATSIGISVATKRNSVYFIKFSKLVTKLRQGYEEKRLEKVLKVYNKYKLLIIDEVGFNEISELDAKLLFQLIDLRYASKSIIITTNVTFDKWVSIMGKDEMITRAILDRILHHSYLFNITGNSYRIKDKLNIQAKKTPEQTGDS